MTSSSFRAARFALTAIISALLFSACITPKDKVNKATLLETTDAPVSVLVSQINDLAQVNSLHAKVDIKFEDNSFARLGIAEKYKTADGEITVQRPAYILLKVKVPFIKTDVAQMASDGKHFQVAVLQDGGSGKFKKFLKGTNDANYGALKEKVGEIDAGSADITKNVNAFSNMRPQHFTEAMLVRPVDTSKYSYVRSTILQEEFDVNAKKKSPLRWVLRGYYLYDELAKAADGSLRISRRFWFDRVGSVRLARLQIFDSNGEIESDIVYGIEGTVSENGNFRLPLQVELTRPKEKYKVRWKYQTPKQILIGRNFPEAAFTLENVWGLDVIDLDQKLKDISQPGTVQNNTTANEEKPVDGEQ